MRFCAETFFNILSRTSTTESINSMFFLNLIRAKDDIPEKLKTNTQGLSLTMNKITEINPPILEMCKQPKDIIVR